MTRRTVALALRYIAWWIAIPVAWLLCRALGTSADIAQQQRDFLAKLSPNIILCFPTSTPEDWDRVFWLALAVILPTIILPCAAAIFSDRQPGLAILLSTAVILLAPASYLAIGHWAPTWPLFNVPESY
jgi:hypothetical protein